MMSTPRYSKGMANSYSKEQEKNLFLPCSPNGSAGRNEGRNEYNIYNRLAVVEMGVGGVVERGVVVGLGLSHSYHLNNKNSVHNRTVFIILL